MYHVEAQYHADDFYNVLEKELIGLVADEKNLIANLANISSWLFHALPDLNWCGFYLWQEEDQELVLAPFQGKPACIRIKPGKGVCGTSFVQGQTIRVDDVDAFPGHIACDSASRSELVVPLRKGDKIFGVLDLDSPVKSRFSQRDEEELTKIMDRLSEKVF